MPFLGAPNETVVSPAVPPAVIGNGPPQNGSSADNGYFYVDSDTGKTYVNIAGTYSPVALVGETGAVGDAGQPQFIGQGAPGVIPGAVLGDLYLDTTTGSLYRLGGNAAPADGQG